MGVYEPKLQTDLYHEHQSSMDTMVYTSTITVDVDKAILHKTTTIHAIGDTTISANKAGNPGQQMFLIIVNDPTSGKNVAFSTFFYAGIGFIMNTNDHICVNFISDGIKWFKMGLDNNPT